MSKKDYHKKFLRLFYNKISLSPPLLKTLGTLRFENLHKGPFSDKVTIYNLLVLIILDIEGIYWYMRDNEWSESKIKFMHNTISEWNDSINGIKVLLDSFLECLGNLNEEKLTIKVNASETLSDRLDLLTESIIYNTGQIQFIKEYYEGFDFDGHLDDVNKWLLK